MDSEGFSDSACCFVGEVAVDDLGRVQVDEFAIASWYESLTTCFGDSLELWSAFDPFVDSDVRFVWHGG